MVKRIEIHPINLVSRVILLGRRYSGSGDPYQAEIGPEGYDLGRARLHEGDTLRIGVYTDKSGKISPATEKLLREACYALVKEKKGSTEDIKVVGRVGGLDVSMLKAEIEADLQITKNEKSI